MPTIVHALAKCRFPDAGSHVDLAVSGGADSVALALLAHAHGLRGRLHHIDHHLRASSSLDAAVVERLADDLGFDFVMHHVEVGHGGNLESRARSARRTVLPPTTMTGHSMDDLAETVLLNLLRGAGVDGLSPMVGDTTKPLLDIRRSTLLQIVRDAGREFIIDETNESRAYLRNRVRLDIMPILDEAVDRDLIPVLARQANLMAAERRWLDELVASDLERTLGEIDCRELCTWPEARLRRWLRVQLQSEDLGDGVHPPGADEVQRVLDVIHGESVATEISGGRRVARSGQHLSLN